MSNNRLLKFGAIGTATVVVCCFTPMLVVLLAAMGLSAVAGVLDYALLPLLGVFMVITVYALVKRQQI